MAAVLGRERDGRTEPVVDHHVRDDRAQVYVDGGDVLSHAGGFQASRAADRNPMYSRMIDVALHQMGAT